LFDGIQQLANSRLVYLPILFAGTLPDVFDGVLARKFSVTTLAFRRSPGAAANKKWPPGRTAYLMARKLPFKPRV
jgi:hypothetical protein